MPLYVQHALVIALASICAIVLLVRRLRVLRAQMSACSACSYAVLCEQKNVESVASCEEKVPRRRLPLLRERSVEG